MGTKNKTNCYSEELPERFAGLAAEQALCYDFIEEAITYGWKVYPEHPESRFDMLLVAEEGCTTMGALPGTQIGVQAKTSLNVELTGQLLNSTRYHQYQGPDYVVALTPIKPRTDNEKVLSEVLVRLGYGHFYMYSYFDKWAGNHFRRNPNLTNLHHVGKKQTFSKRVELPSIHVWTEPGVASPMAITDWKLRAVEFCIMAEAKSGITRKEAKESKMHIQTWLQAGWMIAGEKTGRTTTYVLNPNSPDRPDIHYPDIKKELLRVQAEKKAEAKAGD